jgi:LacI family transcriptional regulator
MNLYDIAKEAGTSIATVSRVINNSPLVKEKTRKRVLEVISKYNFTPNALARGLIQNTTKTIGVFTTDIRSPYFAAVVHSVESQLRALGYSIFLCNTGAKHDEIIGYLRAVLEKKVDGLVFVGSVYKQKVENKPIQYASQKVPVVLLNNHVHGDNIYSVLCDDFMGTYTAVRHLLSIGRKSIAYLHMANSFSGMRKLKGFRKAMSESGVSQNTQRVIDLAKCKLPLIEEIQEEFKNQPFDGIIASDDFYANAVLLAMQRFNKQIPGQISIIGYNNTDICNYTYPALSTIDSRMESLGIHGAHLIHNLLKGAIPKKRAEFLEPYLVLRDT